MQAAVAPPSSAPVADEIRAGPSPVLDVTDAVALIVLGAISRHGFETMVDYTAPVFWFFFLLVGLALFRLRRLEPDRERPFRVPGYPLTPLLFCATCGYMLHACVRYAGVGTLAGLLVLAAGLPVLWWSRRSYGIVTSPEPRA